MSANITTIFQNKYERNFLRESQQTKSLMEPAVTVKSVEGENWFKDKIKKVPTASGIGGDTSTGITSVITRHADTVFNDYDFERRQLSVAEFVYTALVDKQDLIETIEDPKSEILQAGIMALNRKKDDLLIAAATGTVYGGKTGTDTFTFDANNVVASGTTGLSKAKIVAGVKTLLANNVDPQLKKYCVIGPEQYADLMAEDTFISSDYNNTKPLSDGGITYWMGCYFILSNRLSITGSVRHCLTFTQDALCLGLGQDIKSRVQEYQSKNYNWQVFSSCHIGATRLFEEKVIRIDCIES